MGYIDAIEMKRADFLKQKVSYHPILCPFFLGYTVFFFLFLFFFLSYMNIYYTKLTNTQINNQAIVYIRQISDKKKIQSAQRNLN